MKTETLMIIAVAVVVLYLANQRQKQQQQRRTWTSTPLGVTSVKGDHIRTATQFSGSGSSSPGSGVLVHQPNLSTSWGVSGGTNPGFTGVAYLDAPQTSGRYASGARR